MQSPSADAAAHLIAYPWRRSLPGNSHSKVGIQEQVQKSTQLLQQLQVPERHT